MLSCICMGIYSHYKTIIPLLAINNGQYSRALNINFSIFLIVMMIVTIIYILKKYPQFNKQFFGGLEAIRTFFFHGSLEDWPENDSIESIVEASGYSYDSEQNIFFSNMDAWQRDMGYSRLYDEAAAPLGMIIDCEPIYFQYGGKRWLIEFWKGQYDLTTGCEVGVYTTEELSLNIPGPFDPTFYNSASDADRLLINYSLRKNNKILFTRKDVHWWLTGFMLGEFSNPSDLIMDIIIVLKDWAMCNEFIKGLESAGYSNNEFLRNGKFVRLLFDQPHLPQPFTRTELTDSIIQWKNKKMCEQYQRITAGYTNIYDKIEAIRNESPEIYRLIMNFGKTKKLLDRYIKT